MMKLVAPTWMYALIIVLTMPFILCRGGAVDNYEFYKDVGGVSIISPPDSVYYDSTYPLIPVLRILVTLHRHLM